MSDPHLEPAPLASPPFQDSIQVENYFAASSREEILTHALESLERPASIIILSGEEGSGKTTMCKMIEHEAPSDCSVVVFPSTVDSFEDVIRVLASHLNLDLGEIVDRKSVEVCQNKIVDNMVSIGQKLLIIFDEAENIYLATLERIRKLIDLLADAEAKIHVVFSGRPPFLENCEQLSICDFQYSEEFILLLEPLTQEETGDYLRKCIESIPGVDVNQIFTEKVVKDIYSLTAGNFRQINILGEEALQSPHDESFLKDLLVNRETDKKSRTDILGLLDYLKIIKNHSLLPWAGAVVLAIYAIFSFYDSDSEGEQVKVPAAIELAQQEQDVPPVDKTEPEEVSVELKEQVEEIEPIQEKPIEKPGPDNPVAEIQTVEKNLEEIAIEPIEMEPDPADQGTISESIEVIETTENMPQEQEKEVITEPAVTEPVATEPVVTEIVKLEESIPEVGTELVVPEQPIVRSIQENIPEEPVVIKQESPLEKAPVVILHPRESIKRKGEVVEKLVIEPVEKPVERPVEKLVEKPREKPIEKLEPEKRLTQVQEIVAANAHFTTDQLYQKRLAEGISWRAGRSNDKYTVQLMVLTSRTAEKNLKMMLAREDYRGEADNFYIFKNNKELQTIFVFYGEYSSISQARQAQNSLPQFLRVHKPYAISIKGAIAKISR